MINPYEIHCASKMDKNSNGLFALYLDRQWVYEMQKELFSLHEYMPFCKNIINSKSIYMDFIHLCESIFSNEFSIKKEEKIFDFLAKLMIENCNKSENKVQNELSCDIRNFIDKNSSLDFTLEDISKQFLISPFHLIRIFKKEFGLTPYQYILNLKINMAKELLAKKPISEVALNTGFNDQSHLYKYFKQIFSISPNEYKQSLENK